ncbi:MAG: MFS transporter, partial [Sphingomonadales bacterium]|nr:MFS transporter [Sphingomonadales bacterium]
MSGGAPAAPSPGGVSAAEIAVGGVLDELRSVRARFVAPLLLGFIMLFDSWDSIAIAYVMPSLVAQWGLTPVAMGSLMSSGYAGQFVGAVLLGVLAERFGRMPVFLVSMTIMCVLAIACALAPDYRTLFALRFIQGIMIGGALPVSITYINELAPARIRGRYFATFQFIAMSGYAAASLSSSYVIPHLGWRWLFGLGAIPLVLLPLVVMLLPESPRWLARIGRIDKANRALEKLGGHAVAMPEAAHEAPASAPAAPPMSALFAADYRRRTIILIGLWFFTSFANFGLTTWIPSIYVTVFHIPVAQALGYSALASTLFLFVSPTIAVVIDHVGRRPLAIGGTLIATVALLTLAVHPPEARTLLVALIVTGQLAISVGSLIVWPYTAENYPTRVRALGLGMVSSVARGASMLTPVAVGGILGSGGSISMVFAV